MIPNSSPGTVRPKAPTGSSAYVSLQPVAAEEGYFCFEGIDANDGDSLYVTLSRSWQFNTDGDREGWSSSVPPDSSAVVESVFSR